MRLSNSLPMCLIVGLCHVMMWSAKCLAAVNSHQRSAGPASDAALPDVCCCMNTSLQHDSIKRLGLFTHAIDVKHATAMAMRLCQVTAFCSQGDVMFCQPRLSESVGFPTALLCASLTKIIAASTWCCCCCRCSSTMCLLAGRSKGCSRT